MEKITERSGLIRVWSFFAIPAGDGVLLQYGVQLYRHIFGRGRSRAGMNREHAPREVMEKVSRWSSLGRTPFEERIGECTWEVALVIPYTVFF